LQWEHFILNRAPAMGRLQDPDSIVRRLALKGLSPEKPVIVVGEGLKGHGEEGRVAWMLFYLGFNDVQTANIDLFKDSMTNTQTDVRENVAPWKPRLRPALDVSRIEFLDALKRRTQGTSVHIIDVRSQMEYFNKKGAGHPYESPDIQALNIEWKEFFTADGRPQKSLRNKLRSVGISQNDRILVISNQGLRSGAVTWALLALGFPNAGNVTGGYPELLQR
jgi:thiosulfate/3-mercaptopyruvate sulfurtransferase